MEQPLTPEEQKAWEEYRKSELPVHLRMEMEEIIKSLFLSSLRNEKKVKEYKEITTPVVETNPKWRKCILCLSFWEVSSPESHAEGCLNKEE